MDNMIFLTVGTQDKQFLRLLKIVDNAIKKGVVKDEVIAQIGHTKFESNNIKTYKFMSDKRLNEFIEKADLIVTHGGVGFLTTALMKKKKVFAIARTKQYKEHINDHQMQIVDKFYKLKYIKKIETYDDFVREYKNLNKFKPIFPKFDNTQMLNIISDFIG